MELKCSKPVKSDLQIRNDAETLKQVKANKTKPNK